MESKTGPGGKLSHGPAGDKIEIHGGRPKFISAATPPPALRLLSWPALAMLGGLALMLLAPLFVSWTPAGVFWTDADQAAYQKASADLHAASHMRPSAADGKDPRRGGERIDPVAAKEHYQAAKNAWQKEKARLDAAQARRLFAPWLFRLAGMLAAAAGVYGYIRAQGQSGGS